MPSPSTEAQHHDIRIAIPAHLPELSFPTASPMVMSVARTFWEKATAAHVFCAQGRIRSERFARHWHDLAAIARSGHFAGVIADHAIAAAVACTHRARLTTQPIEADRSLRAAFMRRRPKV
ncbi:MAG: nucleotidyl transferase AbiEii/AbiGii toxin family protein [Pseudoxanthomonas sp.]